MKLSKIGIVLLAIGLVVAIMAPVWKWGIAPSFVKLPTDLDRVQTYEGTLVLNVNPSSMAILPPELAIKIPLVITRVLKSGESTGDVTTVQEIAKGVGPGGKVLIDTERVYAFDRKESNNVPGNGSDMEREGYSLFFPFGTQKTHYDAWDNDLEKIIDAEFVEEKTVSGNKAGDINTYLFEITGKGKSVIPPLGLPEEVSGKEIKAIINNPALPIDDAAMMPIDYIKTTDIKVCLEPTTGAPANVINYKMEYFVDASAAGMEPLKLATIEYHQTAASSAESVDEIADSISLISLVKNWLPLIFLLVGIAFMLTGLAVGLRKQN